MISMDDREENKAEMHPLCSPLLFRRSAMSSSASLASTLAHMSLVSLLLEEFPFAIPFLSSSWPHRFPGYSRIRRFGAGALWLLLATSSPMVEVSRLETVNPFLVLFTEVLLFGSKIGFLGLAQIILSSIVLVS